LCRKRSSAFRYTHRSCPLIQSLLLCAMDAGWDCVCHCVVAICPMTHRVLSVSLKSPIVDLIGDVPSRFRECPCFYDQSSLAENNDRAQRCGSLLVRHTQVKLLKPDNGEVFFSEYLLQQRQRKKDFAKHATNSRCQCSICSKNAVPLPHISGDFSREEIVVVEDDESVDVEVETVRPLFSRDNFRKHQQLNHVAPLIPQNAPVPVFSMECQSPFTFPFWPQSCFSSTVQQPATIRPRKRGREREFQCLCEKDRHEQLGRKKPGPTMHTNACKLSKLLHHDY